jgi:hypothetical protein
MSADVIFLMSKEQKKAPNFGRFSMNQNYLFFADDHLNDHFLIGNKFQ